LAFKNRLNYLDDKSRMFFRSLSLLFIGFFLVFVGFIILVVAAVVSGGSGDFSMFIFICPVPLVLGAGLRIEWLVFLSIILSILTVLLFLFFRKKVRRV